MLWDLLLGAYLVGVIVASALFGVTSLQTYYYFQNHSDGVALRYTVAIVWVLECLHTILTSHGLYHGLITDFGNPLEMLKTVWSTSISLGVTAFVTFAVQLFFARRVWLLSGKNVPLVSLIVSLAVAHIGTSWTVTVMSLQLVFVTNFSHGTIQSVGRASISIALVGDTLTAASLCYFLHKGRTGFARTDTLINRLIIYSINNGVLTSTADLATLVLDVKQPQNLLWLAVYQVVGKLYSNSMLATLNFRPNDRRHAKESTQYNSIHLSNIRGRTSAAVEAPRSSLSSRQLHGQNPTKRPTLYGGSSMDFVLDIAPPAKLAERNFGRELAITPQHHDLSHHGVNEV